MGSGNSSSTGTNQNFQYTTYIEQEPRNEKYIQQESRENNDQLKLNKLNIPILVSDAQLGNTLCSNGTILVLQRTSSTIGFWRLPTLQSTNIPWRHGLIRDITWCSDLNVFIILAKDTLFSFDPQPLFIPEGAINRPLRKLATKIYHTVKPFAEDTSFWRCACVGTKLYISYSGYGTIIDEYLLSTSSCTLVSRWTPPRTCATYEGIWCIRYQPDTNQLGFAIVDARNNQWRMEIRSPQDLTLVWQIPLPVQNCECEISPLPNAEWLAINSRVARLFQIADGKLKATVDYRARLKNAIAIGDSYFVVRTSYTIDIYEAEQLK